MCIYSIIRHAKYIKYYSKIALKPFHIFVLFNILLLLIRIKHLTLYYYIKYIIILNKLLYYYIIITILAFYILFYYIYIYTKFSHYFQRRWLVSCS